MRKENNLVRTTQDLERKYDFSQLGNLQKNYELQKESLTKIENELNTFARETTDALENLQDQVDGNITTWFYSGAPTLLNPPASDWNTDELKNNHLGDLYYNQDNGDAYRFILENNVYKWKELENSDLSQVLAIANAAQDTADSKRRVFVTQPSPPYDVGDLWIRNQELYRCQTTKSSTEAYESNDWIVAVKYTDDTVANQVGANLTILSGTVTEIREDVDELQTTMTNTTELVDEQGNRIGTLETQASQTSQTVNEISQSVSAISTNLTNNYTPSEELDQILEEQKNTITTQMTTQMTETMSSFSFDIIRQINENGITTLKNTMVTIDENGINTAKNDEDVVSLLDNEGLYVSDGKKKQDNSNALMIVNRDGGYFKSTNTVGTVKEQDLIQKEKITDEEYGLCQAWYWIGGEE